MRTRAPLQTYMNMPLAKLHASPSSPSGWATIHGEQAGRSNGASSRVSKDGPAPVEAEQNTADQGQAYCSQSQATHCQHWICVRQNPHNRARELLTREDAWCPPGCRHMGCLCNRHDAMGSPSSAGLVRLKYLDSTFTEAGRFQPWCRSPRWLWLRRLRWRQPPTRIHLLCRQPYGELPLQLATQAPGGSAAGASGSSTRTIDLPGEEALAAACCRCRDGAAGGLIPAQTLDKSAARMWRLLTKAGGHLDWLHVPCSAQASLWYSRCFHCAKLISACWASWPRCHLLSWRSVHAAQLARAGAGKT